MSKKRRQFTPEFKLECVLDIISGRKRPVEICNEYHISDSLLTKWRHDFMDNASNLFVSEQYQKNACNARIAELERLVGQLTVELSASKKVLSYFDSR
jgi:transposase-like protein